MYCTSGRRIILILRFIITSVIKLVLLLHLFFWGITMFSQYFECNFFIQLQLIKKFCKVTYDKINDKKKYEKAFLDSMTGCTLNSWRLLFKIFLWSYRGAVFYVSFLMLWSFQRIPIELFWPTKHLYTISCMKTMLYLSWNL